MVELTEDDNSTEEMEPLNAGVVYVFLKKSVSVSRSVRVQWYLKNLNKKIRITPIVDCATNTNSDDIVVISVIPQEQSPYWSTENSHLYEYVVLLSTSVVFVGEVYRIVYCLDISPSVSTLDSQHDEVLLDVIVKALRKSIMSLVQPFIIPGSSHSFTPDIFITVIAHTPFYISPAQQVLVQGWKISLSNLNEFLQAISRQLEFIEDAVAQASGSIHEQFERERNRLINAVSEEEEDEDESEAENIAMVSPGSGFLNLLRYGMLALKLLPFADFSNLVVITDGMITLPDSDSLDSVLNHMRYNDIACCFLHVGSKFYAHCGMGFVPYSEIMQLISAATNGCYIQFPPQLKNIADINIYQYYFLTWSLKRKAIITDFTVMQTKQCGWNIMNRRSYELKKPHLLIRRYSESDTNISLFSVIACRIREGFILKDIQIRENHLYVYFSLPWTNHIYIEYTLSCLWPVAVNLYSNTHSVVYIKAPYEFLHDVTCRGKKPIKSPFRQSLIGRFWRSLKSFFHSDVLLKHLESFMHASSSYYMPESVRSGMPLYYLPTGSAVPVFTSNDIGASYFGQTWRPACLLSNDIWLKWFHADRVGVMLQHDEPLRLYTPNFECFKGNAVQCGQAAVTLVNFLKMGCSFVLVENHSYVYFLQPNESGTGKHAFYVVRSICKPPYVVLHIAFLLNVPCNIRCKILKEFKNEISKLNIHRAVSKKSTCYGENNERGSRVGSKYELQTNCCIILEKPLEKILIRYEQMPQEFRTVVFPDGTQPIPKPQTASLLNRGLITTLSRYLHHRRWIWKANVDQRIFLSPAILETVLLTLVKIRLQEGFYFAHASCGIFNMVLELKMTSTSEEYKELCRNVLYPQDDEDDESGNESEELHTCVIQYVVFPPRAIVFKESNECGEGYTNNVQFVELITECWIEPQYGTVTECPSIRSYMANLQYHQIPDAMWSVDSKCIAALFTLEYMQLMCSDSKLDSPNSIQNLLSHMNTVGCWPNIAPFADQRINQVPFAYSLPNLLCQSQQESLQYNIFSIDMYDGAINCSHPNKLLLDLLYHKLSETHSRELIISGQDAQYLLKNFRKGSASSLFKRNTKTMPPDSFATPTAKDWDRMIAWALGKSRSETKGAARSTAFRTQSEIDEQRKTLNSELSDSRFTSMLDISAINHLDDADWLKWKCYVKFVTRSQCLVTVIPRDIETVRRIALEQSRKSSNDADTSHLSSENTSMFFDMERDAMSVTSRTKTECSSTYASCESTMFCDGYESDENFTPNCSSEHDTAVRDSSDQSEQPFRLRASTWDPVRRVMDSRSAFADRLRTNSVGAKMRPLGRLRPKHQFDSASRDRLDDMPRVRKFVRVTLPLYVYNCDMRDMVRYLVYKNAYITDDSGEEDEQPCRRSVHRSVYSQDSEDSEADEEAGEFNLNEHRKFIESTFTKFYTTCLYKCLHEDYEVPVNDIENAFSKCEKYTLTVNLTEFLKVVCGHLKSDLSTKKSNNASEVSNENDMISLQNLKTSSCTSLQFMQRMIKKKFQKIVTADFKPIPSKPEYYYFSPLWAKDSKPFQFMLNIVNSTKAEPEFHTSSVEHLPVCDPEPNLGMWESSKNSIISEDIVRTSLISNMDSDSLNGARSECVMDDARPLFLKIDCVIQSQNKCSICSVNSIPTCICDIITSLEKPDMSLNINDLHVSLQLHCLTLALDTPESKTSMGTAPDVFAEPAKPSAADYDNNKHNRSFDEILMNKQLYGLPEYQYNALNNCISQIKWLMNDEMATFMLDTFPVSTNTLKMVCDHIESSSNALSCFVEKVPLVFVFGNEEISITNFLQEFDAMRIQNYVVQKAGIMYYLVKTDASDSEKCNVSTDSVSCQDNAAKNDPPSCSTLPEEIDNTLETFIMEDSIKPMEQIYVPDVCKKDESCIDVDEDSDRVLQTMINWLQTRDRNRTGLPNFWLIMTIGEQYVTVYFHCRFLEIDKEEIKEYVSVRESVIHNIKNVCKIVNQKMLLKHLHDTRICDYLLEPQTSPEDGDLEFSSVLLDTKHTFFPGSFACDVVWETKFILHPRLKINSTKNNLSHGIQALFSALSAFSVTNRKHLFVYEDSAGSVFYLRLFEYVHSLNKSIDCELSSNESFSRSSSFTSLNKRQIDDKNLTLFEEGRSRNRSFGDSNDVPFREDYILLKVYGITDVGSDIKCDLVQVLQNRLDDAVLDVISVMLARNPLCKLLSEDVHFIQKPYQPPNHTITFAVDNWLVDNLLSLRCFIKQNLLFFANLPKYADQRAAYHFQDYSTVEDSPNRINEHDIFLYNQSLSVGKGIACFTFSIINFNDSPETENVSDNVEQNVLENRTIEDLMDIVNTNVMYEDSANIENRKIMIEFRIWKQGRINENLLEQKLNTAIKYSMWEMLLEKMLVIYPVIQQFSETNVTLNRSYDEVIAHWLTYGKEINVPSLRWTETRMFIRCNIDLILKELNAEFAPCEYSCYAFLKNDVDDRKDSVYLPFTSTNKLLKHADDDCIFLACSLSCLYSSEYTSVLKQTVTQPKTHGRRLQRMSSASIDDTCTSIKRQQLILVRISESKVSAFYYNLSREKMESVLKMLNDLSEWIDARKNLLIEIAEQKMGLFFNHIYERKNLSKLDIEMANSNLDALLKFSGGRIKPNETPSLFVCNSGSLFRNSRIGKMKNENVLNISVFQQNVNQLLLLRDDSFKARYDYLYAFFSSDVSTFTTETLSKFLSDSRLIHYCLTPLLFMMKWRVDAAATRDHTFALKILETDLSCYDVDHPWHQNVCAHFVHEYKLYLHSTMGFNPIPKQNELLTTRMDLKRDANNINYLQKFSAGGILVYEIFLCEPFFNAKLYAIDYSRLNEKQNTVPQKYSVDFLDECDSVKFQMHLHSFTYDYHLRSLYQFIFKRYRFLKPGFHITSFLDHFLKYYPKAPNYARCLAYSETLTVNDIQIAIEQLYNFLITYGKKYNMDTFSMISDDTNENEYVLIQQKTISKSYRDSNDKQQTEDFDVLVIVGLLESDEELSIKLQIYVLLINQSNMYPKTDTDNKLGKFRTVSKCDYAQTEEQVNPNPPEANENSEEESSVEPSDEVDNKKKIPLHLEIKQEVVNYLGYYSFHEELMQDVMTKEFEIARNNVTWIIMKGAFDCETHFLWSKLLSLSPVPLNYTELKQLLNLANIMEISKTDSPLEAVLDQSIIWIQTFMKYLISKYPNQFHFFVSPDGQKHELIMFHPAHCDGFIMMILDTETAECRMNLVCRKGVEEDEESLDELQGLFEKIINTYCFNLWRDCF